MFTKTLTAGVLAVSLALTSLSPTQAQASFSEEDAVVGILTLLLLGAAIHNSRDNGNDRPRVDPNAWKVLPDQCLRQTTRRNGNSIRFFGQRCMNNNYAYVSRLPQACHVRFRNENGQRRQGWRARCLRNEGFRFNRH
ncbi:hypothetical protein [Pseudooctadecabacter jejudonensis]|uniref:YARHG domain-containing protein n=1 Tax=Pseudooctadecabacter jejudonensis TaxID=1391910 RepID=A0A1Y5S9M8_9RHOB|nr:hypothetical protein [Pseudooctadecabacter jejudonensis]SLN34960.1 hypothetical protein PSJ8397_01752 [Pseudooctadecabacter jejudonensis]